MTGESGDGDDLSDLDEYAPEDADADAPAGDADDPDDPDGGVEVDAPADGEGGADADERASPGGPLGDLAAEVRERRQAGEEDALADLLGEADDVDVDPEEAFEDVDVADVDVDDLWAALDESGGTVAVPTEAVADEAERDVRVIPKRTCHGCRYFGAPPDLHCTHEGTEIREVVDADSFEVVDCPMVVDTIEIEGLGE